MHNYAKVPFEKRTFTKEGGPKPALARDRMLTTGVPWILCERHGSTVTSHCGRADSAALLGRKLT